MTIFLALSVLRSTAGAGRERELRPEKAAAPTKVSYKITKIAFQWMRTRNGKDEGSFVGQEAAFETAAAHAGGDLRSGYDIIIEAGSPTNPEGAQDRGGVPMSGDGFSS